MHALLLGLLFSMSGFDRIYVDPEPNGAAALEIANPFEARAIVSVDGVEVGELSPKATGIVKRLKTGSHKVAFELPNGFIRTDEATAK